MTQFVAFSPADIRATMGVSVSHFAAIVGCSRQSVTRWESVPHPKLLPIYHSRLRQVLKSFHRSRSPRFPIRVAYVDLERMNHFLGKPGTAWIHWTWKHRLSFMAHRAQYRRLLAEAQAGRLIMEYRVGKKRLKAMAEEAKSLDSLREATVGERKANVGNLGNR